MKNITLSADEALIEAARERARQRQTTLNAEFRQWLARYSGAGDGKKVRYRELMASFDDVAAQGPFGRDAMNERGR